MKIVLQVFSGNENCDGGCELALVDLVADLAALALQRCRTLKEEKSRDPDVDESYYWDSAARYFSPWTVPVGADKEGGTAGPELEAVADEVEAKGVVLVPEDFDVPQSHFASVECQQMIVGRDSIRFLAIPKHASFYVQTAEIPVGTLESVLCHPARG